MKTQSSLHIQEPMQMLGFAPCMQAQPPEQGMKGVILQPCKPDVLADTAGYPCILAAYISSSPCCLIPLAAC